MITQELEEKLNQLEATLDTILIAMDPKNVANKELIAQVRSLCAQAEVRDHKRKHVDKAKSEYEDLKMRLIELEKDYSFLKGGEQ